MTKSGLPVGDLPEHGAPSVDLALPRTVLAVGAHPDDIEFGCGATLAKWAARGSAVVHAVLTDGSKGTWDPGADLPALIEARKAECRAAASVIDGDRAHPVAERVHFFGYPDGELDTGPAARRALTAVIRDVAPDVVLGHDPWRRYRLHPDHRAAGFLTVDAIVAARDPHFFPDLGRPPHRPGALLLFEPDVPNHVETVTAYAQVKIAALLCHASQQGTTMGILASGDAGSGSTGTARRREIDDFAQRIHRQLASHGGLAGVDAGEAFHLIDAL
ncbi:MAG: PIG-L family deacetylase [Actinomycetota bacterium]|nr:PIG-L family deacetylase [Actinomycetota bacterium]